MRTKSAKPAFSLGQLLLAVAFVAVVLAVALPDFNMSLSVVPEIAAVEVE